MADQFKFTAFISYSHADQKVVKWLHHALENYRVPVKLVGKETPAGKVPGKFKPIFRDRDDLSAAASLTDTIKEALKQSKFLIVVCSANAAKSVWVEKEIREFKRLRGQEYILCLIAEGADDNKDPFFPPALWDDKQKKSDYEPIAADMRATGDGKRMAKLKLISGILGVELDTLVQRDTKRRQIQMAVMSVTFSLTTVVLSVLLYMAVEARKEAEINRQQAEDLVGFMLGDLRDKLEPIGSLQLMDSISMRALDYYSKIDAEDMTTESLSELSRILLFLGENQELRGNTDAARSAFLEANQTLGELLVREPGNPDLTYDYAQSQYWLGFIDLRLKNYEAAENFFQDYAESIEKLVAIDPDNLDYQAEVGRAHSNLGTVYFSQGHFLKAQEEFKKAVDVHLARAESDLASEAIQLDLAGAQARLADAKTELGYFADAENLRQKERRIYTDILNRTPDNRAIWGSLGLAYEALGRLALYQEEEKQSLLFFDQGIEVYRSITAYDPENTEWKENLVQLYIGKAKALTRRRDYDDAEALINRALSITKSLLAINPGFTNWVLKDYRARVALAETQINTRKKRSQGLESAKTLASSFYQEFPPDARTSEMHFLSAEILGLLAEAYEKNGDKDAARDNWKTVVGILEPYVATGGLAVITLLPEAKKQSQK